MTIELIDEAVASGARIEKACDVVGISTRTLERWRSDEECVDRRAGPRHAPARQLTEAERAKILEVASSPEFRDESPKQIVPTLADRGEYIASDGAPSRRATLRGIVARMRALAVLPCLVLVVACGSDPDASGDAGSDTSGDAGRDASNAIDAATDAGALADAQADAGSDAGPPRSAGCASGAGLAEGEHTFELEGRSRRYVLRLPAGYTRDRAWPLVLALHGNDGSVAYWDVTSGPRDIRTVLRDDAILIVPEAIGGDWRDYAMAADTWPARIESELLYFDEVLAQAREDLCVREDAIFAMGFSGGGSFSGVLACRRTDIRAIAVGGSVIYFDADDCVGHVAAWITIGATELNAGREQLRDFFRDRAGCEPTSTGTDPDPCVAYDGCDPRTPVHYCQHPGDHVWPDFGNEAMWAFFEQQLE